MGSKSKEYYTPLNSHMETSGEDRDKVEFESELKRNGLRLDYVFELVWKSFCEHPGVKEYAEFQTLPLSFWIVSKAERQPLEYEILILLNSGTEVPDGLNPCDEVHKISFEGDDAWKQIESFVYERLGLNPGSLTLYELPGQHKLMEPL